MNEMTLPRTITARPRHLHALSHSRLEAVPTRQGALTATDRVPWSRGYLLRIRISDVIVVAAAIAASSLFRFAFAPPQSLHPASGMDFVWMSAAISVAWILALTAFRSHDLAIIGFGAAEYRRVVNASTTTFGLAAIGFLVAGADSARWYFIVGLPLGAFGLLLSRWLWRQWLIRQRKHGRYLSSVIVAGRRQDVEKVIRQIESNPASAYHVVAAVLDDPNARIGGATLRRIPVFHDLDKTVEHTAAMGVDCVVIAGQPEHDGGSFVRDLAWALEGRNVDLVLATSLANVAGPRIHLRPVDGLPLLQVEIPQFEGGKHVLKRIMDVAASAAALIVLSPMLAIIAIAVRLDSDGKALFAQERVGRGGETFRIYKFRSMVVDAPERLAALRKQNEGSGPLFKLKNDPRVTRVGKFLRKYSLDEFPQLWNVLIGDMSLVGPRPPLPDEVEDYEAHVRRRLFIKPGLTGMWQVNGRSLLSWEDSVRLDLYYVENWSVVGDLMIMWRTVKVLLRPVGAF